MKKIYLGYLIIFGLMTNASCQSSNNKIKEQSTDTKEKCSIYNESEIFENAFLPFESKKYNTKNLLQYFVEGVVVDSVDTNQDGFESGTYIFTDGKSKISFFVKSKMTDEWFYLYSSSIKTNLLKTKSGIEINMTKDEFYKKMNLAPRSCDTLEISEGLEGNSYYFIFEKELLKRIDILPQ